jgi:hypothetical protein
VDQHVAEDAAGTTVRGPEQEALLSHIRFQKIPAVLVVLTCLATPALVFSLDLSQLVAKFAVAASVLPAAVGAGLFWRRLHRTEAEAKALYERSAADRELFLEQREGIERGHKDALVQIERQLAEIAREEQELADRFITYHEWMEFPRPVDLSDVQEPERRPEELAKRDRELMKFLQAESVKLFESIRTNKYLVGGRIDPLLVRTDLNLFVKSVAQIYRPDVTDPLMDTNIEAILRAVSRAGLQFLAVADQLPLNLKGRSLASLYAYLQQGTSYYDTYKKAERYFPYINTAYYLGRFAMGANPITMGAWWFVSSLGKRGAQQIAQNLINRQAIALLQQTVQVIGFEIASTFGGDFRHRDANWIYAAELAELVSRFPLTQKSLSGALKEVGSLQLRSEYDRVFLYRCLAEHVSPRPDQYRPVEVLTATEKQAVAGRLERFLRQFIHGKSPEVLLKWQAEVEIRLGVKLETIASYVSAPEGQQRQEAVRSLASFLVATKEREPEELAEFLTYSKLFMSLPYQERQDLLRKLIESPPYFLEQPDLDPSRDLAAEYVDDLATLAVRVSPHDEAMEEIVVNLAGALRRSETATRKKIADQIVEMVRDRLPATAPMRKLPVDVARSILDLQAQNEPAQFVYDRVSVEGAPAEKIAPWGLKEIWLAGIGDRLLAFTPGSSPRLVWRATKCSGERIKGIVASDLRLVGGDYLHPDLAAAVAAGQTLTLRVSGAMMMRYEQYFSGLLERVQMNSVTPSPNL